MIFCLLINDLDLEIDSKQKETAGKFQLICQISIPLKKNIQNKKYFQVFQDNLDLVKFQKVVFKIQNSLQMQNFLISLQLMKSIILFIIAITCIVGSSKLQKAQQFIKQKNWEIIPDLKKRQKKQNNLLVSEPWQYYNTAQTCSLLKYGVWSPAYNKCNCPSPAYSYHDKGVSIVCMPITNQSCNLVENSVWSQEDSSCGCKAGHYVAHVSGEWVCAQIVIPCYQQQNKELVGNKCVCIQGFVQSNTSSKCIEDCTYLGNNAFVDQKTSLCVCKKNNKRIDHVCKVIAFQTQQQCEKIIYSTWFFDVCRCIDGFKQNGYGQKWICQENCEALGVDFQLNQNTNLCECPYNFYRSSLTCSLSCPDDKVISSNNSCVDSCLLNQVNNNGLCTNSCEYPQFNRNGICVSQCQLNQYFDEMKCKPCGNLQIKGVFCTKQVFHLFHSAVLLLLSVTILS